MAEEKPIILIVEDDLDIADMLNAYFRVQGYEVLTVNWGEDGVRAAETTRPDLIILDIRLPDIDGYEVTKRLRASRNTQSIPIIFLTDKRSRQDKLKGLEIGGDDYITKPFDVQELRLRVRNALNRRYNGPVNNPVSNLPEGPIVDERLQEILEEDGWAILLVTLENLENFRESYGFVASDDVLRAVSLMVHNTVREIGDPQDFLGHLTASRFCLVTKPHKVKDLQEHVLTRLEQSLDYFYPLKDRGDNNPQPPDQRLAITVSNLDTQAGPFEDIDELKTRLLQSKNPTP